MERSAFQPRVIGILRGVDREFFAEIVTASFEAGLPALEVTMNTQGAAVMIAENRSKVPAGRFLGAGTVRTIEEAEAAIEAGAMFIVTPNVSPRVIEFATSRGIPVIAGALTPTEVFTAWQAGAAMVKVFPCDAMGGASYIKSLLGPLDHIPLAAVGGVSFASALGYFEAGARSVGVSSALFGKVAIEEKNIKELTKNVKKFIRNVSQYG